MISGLLRRPLMTLAAVFLCVFGISELTAQCNGGGCGGCGKQKIAKRVDQPGGGCPNGGCSKRAAAEAQPTPEWKSASSEALEDAVARGIPVLIFFPGEGEEFGDSYLAGEDFVELASTGAVFVRVAYTSDREASPDASDSPVPVSRLLGDNPSRDYGVRSYPTFIVADSHGNEYYRITSRPKADDLSKYFEKVAPKAEKLSEKLQKNLDSAREFAEGGDRAAAIRSILKNFKEGVVGFEAQEESIRLYHELLDAGREEASGLSSDGAEDAVSRLKLLAGEFKGTELESEIKAMLKDRN